MSRSAAPVDWAGSSPFGPARAGTLVALLQLNWFIRRRWYFICAAVAVLAIERFAMPTIGRPSGLAWVLVCLAAVNVAWMFVSFMLYKRIRSGQLPEAASIRGALIFANIQVAVDLFMLTLILRYTGGVENPMAVFYLFHMVIGSLLLKAWQAVLQGAWAVMLYAAMGLGELAGRLSPHYEFLPGFDHPALYVRPEYVTIAVVVLAAGVFGMLTFALQITARLDDREHQLHEAMAALQKSQTAIQDLQARRSRFMQTAAHQLKSPLAAVQTMGSLIAEQIVQGEAVRKTAESIVRRSQEGISAVGELLTLARVQDADPYRHRESVADVGEVVKRICVRRSLIAEQKGLAFTWQVPEGVDLRANVNEGDLNDCVDNLVENAIKYTPAPGQVAVLVYRQDQGESEHGSAAEAARSTGEASSFVAASVRDTGMGIAEADLMGADATTLAGSVFDAFRRGNGALAAGIPGSGLGLSIVRGVVEQAGGRIQVRSRVGEGSNFTVMFPAVRSRPGGVPVHDTRASEVIIGGANGDKPAPTAASAPAQQPVS